MPKELKLRAIEKEHPGIIEDRDELFHFTDDDVIRAAKSFWHCGLLSPNDLKRARPINRNFTLEDLRAAGCSARKLAFPTAISHVPPTHRQTGGNGGSFTECATPKLLPQFQAGLSGISHLLSPGRAMVNEASNQLAEGAACAPANVPFVAANLADHPWKPQLPTHEKAGEDWNNRTHSLRSVQPLPFQSYIYYHLRFIYAAHLAGACAQLGGYFRSDECLRSTVELINRVKLRHCNCLRRRAQETYRPIGKAETLRRGLRKID